MYFDDRTAIGLVLTSLGAAMRDPVTTISARAVSGCAVAVGDCCARAGRPVRAIAAAMSNRRQLVRQASEVAAPIARLPTALSHPKRSPSTISYSPKGVKSAP